MLRVLVTMVTPYTYYVDSISNIKVILKKLAMELQKFAFTNGFRNLIASSQNIHEIYYLTNIVSPQFLVFFKYNILLYPDM